MDPQDTLAETVMGRVTLLRMWKEGRQDEVVAHLAAAHPAITAFFIVQGCHDRELSVSDCNVITNMLLDRRVEDAKLTPLMKQVLSELRRRKCDFLAAAAERHWKGGTRYYIDSRVPVAAGLRRDFETCNQQAEGKQ